jgi:hypothetical protein
MSWMKRLAVFAIFMTLCATPALADGKLSIVAKFVNADAELDVATYQAGDGTRVLLLGILDGQRRNSVAFGPTETGALFALWRQASSMRAGDWRYVGDFVETGTSDTSHLKISAGPGVRFIIESPAKGAFTVDLATANIAAFSAALGSANDFVQSTAR